jgi:AcrR family transcriptional regulator
MPRSIPPERFQELVDAATRVLIAQGYRRTQMADVAREMGVAKGTIYLYVESKEALLDVALRHADVEGPVPLPQKLPVPTPPPGATLAMVERRVAAAAQLPELDAALARRRVGDVAAEFEAILRELYRLLWRNRLGIKLLDRCSADHPELGGLWYKTGREGMLGLLTRYIEDRVRRGRMRRPPDQGVAARQVLETLVFWAVHRPWDPAPQVYDEAAVEDTLVTLLRDALVEQRAQGSR